MTILEENISNPFIGRRKEGNVLFNDALNTFYLRIYGVGHVVKDHSDSERGNPLPPHGLIFPISSKCTFTCTIPQMEYWLDLLEEAFNLYSITSIEYK